MRNFEIFPPGASKNQPAIIFWAEGTICRTASIYPPLYIHIYIYIYVYIYIYISKYQLFCRIFWRFLQISKPILGYKWYVTRVLGVFHDKNTPGVQNTTDDSWDDPPITGFDQNLNRTLVVKMIMGIPQLDLTCPSNGACIMYLTHAPMFGVCLMFAGVVLR